MPKRAKFNLPKKSSTQKNLSTKPTMKGTAPCNLKSKMARKGNSSRKMY